MDASLLANTGCGGFFPTQRVKGCKIGLQFVFLLYHPDFVYLLYSGAWFDNSCKQRLEDYWVVFALFLVSHQAPHQTSPLFQ